MGLKKLANSSFKLSVAATGVVGTFFTIIQLMVFLSDPHINKNYEEPPQEEFWLQASRALLINSFLVMIFMFQHSLLALPIIKDYFARKNLLDIQRSVYVIGTCVSLQVLLNYWCEMPYLTLWHINARNRFVYWAFILIHSLGWMIIYVGNICMDLNELLGIKQVYYSLRNLPEPNSYKSYELRKLYSHMRHPSFIGFIIVFWCIPVMSWDRLLLASILTYYMYMAWKTDRQDYHYQEVQYAKKFGSVRY